MFGVDFFHRRGMSLNLKQTSSYNLDWIEEAPLDGKSYVRQGGKWIEQVDNDTVFPEAPVDGKLYLRKNGQWTEVSSIINQIDTPDTNAANVYFAHSVSGENTSFFPIVTQGVSQWYFGSEFIAPLDCFIYGWLALSYFVATTIAPYVAYRINGRHLFSSSCPAVTFDMKSFRQGYHTIPMRKGDRFSIGLHTDQVATYPDSQFWYLPVRAKVISVM